MQLGLDYAGSPPGAAAVKQAGYSFVARYLSRYAAKTIRPSEFSDMTNNGVAVVLVFEDYADQALKGFNQGVLDAQFAVAEANGLGWPPSRPIYFAVDFDISDAQKPAAGEYMKGAISVLGVSRVGAYGGYWWIKYCVDNGLAAYFWQAVAWSGGNRHPSNNLFQRLGGVNVNGTECDVNEALKNDYGQWPIKGIIMTEDSVRYAYKAVTGMEVDTGAWTTADVRYWTGRDVTEFTKSLYKYSDNFIVAAENRIKDLEAQLANQGTQLKPGKYFVQ